ncbi:MAG: cupredoxin domain-containing protein [Actinobacteria bacterium]|nr:cupredoxin domain-containing protein [Actinomycetota bacterium]
MARPLRVCLLAVTGLLLAGCLSGEPRFAEAQQVSAEQREALTATEGAGGGEAGGDGGAASAEFVAIDIAYEAAPDEVPAGPVAMTLVNNGSIEHNVVIEELDDRKVLDTAGGETDQAEVELEAGEYTYFCDVAGHRAAGMEGELTVTG